MESLESTVSENPRLIGKIECDHVGRSRALRRLVERSLARWIQEHHLTALSARYRAVFRRTGEGHCVVCHIEVRTEDQKTWIGLGFENGIHQALMRSLDHLVLFQNPVSHTA
ncbi:MAG: hypothetical protein ACXVCH_18055 [Bdellovibrionota bacterium]